MVMIHTSRTHAHSSTWCTSFSTLTNCSDDCATHVDDRTHNTGDEYSAKPNETEWIDRAHNPVITTTHSSTMYSTTLPIQRFDLSKRKQEKQSERWRKQGSEFPYIIIDQTTTLRSYFIISHSKTRHSETYQFYFYLHINMNEWHN